MAKPDPARVRNVAFLSHGGGGKTTLIESLLFNCKEIKERGQVEKGSTVMTTEKEEVSRGITITPHVGYCSWKDHEINVIDTPGYMNFLESARGVVHVTEGAVLVVSGLSGVKPESARLWTMCEEAKLPVIAFVNKMDRDRSDFVRALDDIEQSFGLPALPINIPIGTGEDFVGILNLIPKEAWTAKDGKFTKTDFPEQMRSDVEQYRGQLVEKIVETNDQLLEQYLDGKEPDEETLHKTLREAVAQRKLVPVYCGSGLANIGVRSLAEGIVHYLPSPVERNSLGPLVGADPVETTKEESRQYVEDAPMSAVVFKTIIDPFSGKLSIMRVWSGVVEADKPLYNGSQQAKEKGGHLFKIQGKEMTKVDRLVAGEIGAMAKLDGTHTGDTLCATDHPIVYPRVHFTEPVLAYAVTAEGRTEDKVAAGLKKLVDEDPTLRFYREERTQEMILAGMGQTHLEVTLDRLSRKFGATAVLKTPMVPYRETIGGKARVQGRLKKQTGGHGQFGDCWIEMEPLSRGQGFEFVDQIKGGVIPRQFIPSVEKGVREAMEKGVLAGYPVVDVRVTVVDGSYHSVDSSDYAFKVAGSLAFKKGMEQSKPTLLEPVMSMEIVVPEDAMGEVIRDLNSRRAKVQGVTPGASSLQKIKADAPMSEVLEYGNVLHAVTSGRGLYTMQLTGYQEISGHIAKKVIEQSKPEEEQTASK